MLRRRFHISDILSITTGHVVSRRGIRGVRALWAFMAGREFGWGASAPFLPDPYGGEMPSAFLPYTEDFRDAILATYPELGAYEPRDVPPPEFRSVWVSNCAAEFAEYLEVPGLPLGHPLRAAMGPVEPDPDNIKAASNEAADIQRVIDDTAAERREYIDAAKPTGTTQHASAGTRADVGSSGTQVRS